MGDEAYTATFVTDQKRHFILPKRYLDVEIGEHIDVFPNTIKEANEEEMTRYFNALKVNCAKYNIKYVPVDIQEPFAKILNTFMVERQRFSS